MIKMIKMAALGFAVTASSAYAAMPGAVAAACCAIGACCDLGCC